MRSVMPGLTILVVGGLWLTAADVAAQQVTVSTPYHSVGEGFFEYMGVNWGLGGKNWFFNFGGPNNAAPQFGGFDPSAGANFGFAFQRGGVNGFFNANYWQGWRQTFTTQAPIITLQNGVPGFVSDTSQSPFVISYLPVVGGFPTVGVLHPAWPLPAYMTPSSGCRQPAVLHALQRARMQRHADKADGLFNAPGDQAGAASVKPPALPRPQAQGEQDDLVLIGGGAPAPATGQQESDESSRKLAAVQSSSAGRPAPSVADAQRLHAADQVRQQSEVLRYLERGRNAEAMGKPNVAKIYYQMAARRASGQLRKQILTRIAVLRTDSQSR